MADAVQAYFALLEALRANLAQLTELAGEKIEAVRNADLLALDAVMNREQALALSFRKLEMTRGPLLEQLNLQNVPLSQTARRLPPQVQGQAAQAIQALQAQYAAYQAKAKEARDMLEGGLREIDSIITELGGSPLPEEGAGYTPPAPAEPPPSMKTDFRA